MKIIFTRHALSKFEIFAACGVKIGRKNVESAIKQPENLDFESDYPKMIASTNFNSKHVIRVVYKREDDIIKVITFYPAEKGRYY